MRTFTLTDAQEKQIQVWVLTLMHHMDIWSPKITYRFTETGIGLSVTVVEEKTQCSLDVTDYESW